MGPHSPPRWLAWLNRSKWWVGVTLLLAGLGWWLLVERPMTFYRSAVGASEAHKEALEIQNRALTTGAQIFLGLAVLVGAYLTFRRVRAVEKHAEAAHQGQLTERFTRAIEHLGDERAPICLGGIYALERIACDSPRDHPQVIEVLCAFVREQTHATPSESGDERIEDPTEDSEATEVQGVVPPSTVVQAALDVIGRNPLPPETRSSQPLNLQRVRLPGAHLSGAHLMGADFFKANLSEAQLDGADLADAILSSADLSRSSMPKAHLTRARLHQANLTSAGLFEADLSGTDLTRARLSEAELTKANLTAANLSGARLQGANLFEARLSGARLHGAFLQGAYVTLEQIESAHINEHTRLPELLVEDREEQQHPDPIADPAGP